MIVASGRTARKAIPVAVIVGTILSAVNLGPTIAAGDATYGTWVTATINYIVPYVVASIGYLSGRRRPRIDAAERADRPRATDWRGYVGEFHDDRPAITERLLALTDHSPYAWLAEPLRDIDGPMLDLACGSAPTRDHLPTARWVGLDFSAAELAAAREAGRGPLVRASADALPLRDRSLHAVCAAMCLPVVTPLDDVLAELKRVMRPGATLAALVPARLGLSPAGWLGWLTVMRALGIRGQPWPNPQARDGLARLLRAHGFEIVSDDRRVFRLDLAVPDSTDLLVDSLYLPDLVPQRVDDAKRALRHRATSPQRLPLPLRRVVASMPAAT